MKYVRLHPAAYRKLKASAKKGLVSKERLDELLHKEKILDALENAVEEEGITVLGDKS